ncbi:hypothetical protein Dip510_000182 [Elusimicrobium posterum]|uniref:iron-containing alcohol dehydrogenase n=1 Tax=Elusimicrobium posterum TaxID=3116653 RepID=UPI003C70DB2E
MNNFQIWNSTKIIFGKDTQKSIGAEVKKYSSKILLHYGGGSIKKNGLYADVTASLKAAGVEYVELGGVKPNPRLSLVKEGIEICRKEKIDFVLAAGGGSVIDSAKAIATGVHYEGDLWEDLFVKKGPAGKILPVATILTIPAAGSESSANSVVTDEETQMKLGYSHPLMRPVFSILNPQYCFTLPADQAAYGVCDMMAHIFERYFTHTKNTELTDKLCEGVLKTIINNAPKVIKKKDDYNAWAEIMWAGSLAHNGLLGTGRDEDWASHGIEHPLSAIFDIAHGAGLAIIFPAWMKYVYKENIAMFAQFAAQVWDVSDPARDQEELALKGIEMTETFFKSIGLPVRLSEVNITQKDFEALAKKAVALGPLGSFKKLEYEDVVKIYKLAV